MTEHFLSISYLQGWVAEHKSLWLRPLVIVGVLLLSLLIPFLATQTYMMAALALPFVIVGVVIITRWPQLGFFAIIAGLVIPFNGPSGFNSSMVLVAGLLGLWILDMMVRQHKIQLVPSKTILPLLVLVVVATISFGMGLLPWYTFAQAAPLGAQLGGWSIYILSASAFLIVAHLGDLRWLKWMVWFFLALGAIFIAGQLIRPLGQINRGLFNGSTGSLFWTWLMALAFSQAVFNRDLHWSWRGALFALVGAIIFVSFVLNDDWKSGWIPPLATVAAILGIRYWRISLLIAPFAFIPTSYLVTQTIATDEYSWGTRVDAWLIVAEITRANPIFGLGFANYNSFAILFPIRGYAVRFNSHSQYVDIVAQTGIIGLMCILWFFGAVAWVGWQLRDRVPAGFPRAYVYGALGGLVGMLVAAALGDWVLPFFYNVGLRGFRASVLGWLFLGGLVILEQMYIARPSEDQGV